MVFIVSTVLLLIVIDIKTKNVYPDPVYLYYFGLMIQSYHFGLLDPDSVDPWPYGLVDSYHLGLLYPDPGSYHFMIIH